MKNNKRLKKLGIIFSCFIGFLSLLCIILILMFFSEIRTMMSVKKINDKTAYEVTYHGDYALDRYLETGSKDWNELFNFINSNLAKGVAKYIYGEYGCSAFFARTPEGDYILARNLDTIEAFPAIIKTDTKTGYKTVGIANLSVAGWKENNLLSKSTVISSPYFTFDGMNQYGLAVCALSVPFGSSSAIDSSKTTLHDLTVDRVIMDKTKNVKEAIDLLSQYNVKMEERYPTHYMIADSEGNSAIVEYINGSMKIIENEEDYQIATNFILYDNENLKGYSSERYAEFEKSLSQASGILSMEAALELLEENVVPGEAQWSVVYNLTKRTMAVEFYGDYDKTYYYDINE